jgi:putative glutamine transport system substrate-binding protein
MSKLARHLPTTLRASVLGALLAASVAHAQPAAGPTPSPSAPALRGDSWSDTQRIGSGTVTVAYYYPLEGFTYRDSSGKLTGLLIDMMEQLRSYLKNVRGADVTYRFVPYGEFPRFYEDVRRGRGGVIGLAGTTLTEARKREISFSPPFFASRPVLVTNAAVPELASREHMAAELAGFTGIAFRGTTLDVLVRRLAAEGHPALPVESLSTYQEVVQRISRDPKAFAYLDLNIFWVARKGGAAIRRHRVADEPREDFALIMPLRSDWQRPVADFFAAGGGYRNSRSYRSLVIKHLGVDLDELLENRSR